MCNGNTALSFLFLTFESRQRLVPCAIKIVLLDPITKSSGVTKVIWRYLKSVSAELRGQILTVSYAF